MCRRQVAGSITPGSRVTVCAWSLSTPMAHSCLSGVDMRDAASNSPIPESPAAWKITSAPFFGRVEPRHHPRRHRFDADGHRTAVSDSDRHVLLDSLFEANYEAVIRYARRRTAQLADAEDVVAETFVVAWRRLDDLPAPGERIYWLYGIAGHVIANQRRGAQRRRRLLEKAQAASTVAEQAGSQLPDVVTAISRLRPVDQEILRLVAWEGLSHSEVGVVLGISANAAGIRLHRARTRLEHALNGPVPGDLKGFRRIRTFVGWKGSASRRSQREEAP